MSGRQLFARARAAELRLPPRPRARIALGRPSARTGAVVAGTACALVLAYLVARETPLFAVQRVEVSGAPPALAAEIREALAPVDGESLVALDPAAVAERVRNVPSVRTAWVDRAFPHTLSVVVAPEKPLAVVRLDERAWVVAESGRLIATTTPHGRSRLPRIRDALEHAPALGETLAAPGARTALETLRSLPARFPARVLFAEVREGRVVLMLDGWIEVRLGSPVLLEAKLRAAGAVLRAMSDDERAAVAYVDAALPERVVAGDNSQPESESLESATEVPAN